MSWSGLTNSTLRSYLNGAVDLCLRQRPVTKRLLAKSKVNYDGGTAVDWAVDMREYSTTPWTGERITHTPLDPHKRAHVDWKTYLTSDTLDEETYMKNRGDSALIKLFKKRGPKMKTSQWEKISLSLYKNGNTSTTDWHGLETMFTAANAATANKISSPNGSYAGLTTNLGTYGGTCTANLTTSPNATVATDWPDGISDVEYGFWAPLLLNYTSSAWVDGSHVTWGDTALRCIRQAKIWRTIGTGVDGIPDLLIMSGDLFYQLENAQDAKITIEAPAANDLEVGVSNGIRLEGLKAEFEQGVTASTAYLLNTNHMEMMLLGKDWQQVVGPDRDPHTHEWLTSITAWGQWRFESPCYFGKLYAAA